MKEAFQKASSAEAFNGWCMVCSSKEHQQQHWAAGHKRLCRKLGIAAGLHVRGEKTAEQPDGIGKDIAQKKASVQAHRLVPSTMVCPYNEFLALWAAAEGSSEPPTGLINPGNR